MRTVGVWSLAGLVLALACGCQKSNSTEGAKSQSAQPPAPKAPALETVARLHWWGKNRIAADSNSTAFMRIWNLPQTTALQNQTLDKLALALARVSSTNLLSLTNSAAVQPGAPTATNSYAALVAANPAASLLRPLLEDLIREECYLELRNAGDQPVELALAVRLKDERAASWETNLMAAMELLSGAKPMASVGAVRSWPSAFSSPFLSRLSSLSLARSGEWTLVGLSAATNLLLSEWQARLQSQPGTVPFESSGTNDWVEMNLDSARVAGGCLLVSNLLPAMPRVHLAMTGDGENVRTRGELTFPKPLAWKLEPWNIPTNVVHDPLISFTAMQGFEPWLSSLPAWTNLHVGSAPNQAFLWSMETTPLETYWAAPWTDATNHVNQLAEYVLDHANRQLSTNRIKLFERATNGNGLVWSGIPFLTPFLKSTSLPEGDFALGGFIDYVPTNRPPPVEMMREVNGRTNLLCYSWEFTGMRVEGWLYAGQLFRLVAGRPQLPVDSTSIAWFRGAAPLLGNCTTVLTRKSPEQWEFARKSTLGFNALELHLLADWLESPTFPEGLHTLVATNVPPPVKHRRPLAKPGKLTPDGAQAAPK